MIQPTYSATEIREMCLNFELDHGAFKILVELIERELHLYDEDELAILMQSSMIVFNRALFTDYFKFFEMKEDELYKIAYDIKYGSLFLNNVTTPIEFFENRNFAAQSKPKVLKEIVEKLSHGYSHSPEIPK